MGEDEREEFSVEDQTEEYDTNEYDENTTNINYEDDTDQTVEYEDESSESKNNILKSNTTKVEYTYVDEDGNEVDCVQYETVQTTMNGWSISATIFGGISLVAWIIPAIGFATSIIGMMLSAISFRYTRSPLYSRTSQAKIAITMSIIGFFLALAFSIVKVILFIM